jgi:hypothetical protein
MAEEGKTRVLGKRVYFEKMLETGGCSGLLEREQEEKDASLIDNCPRRRKYKKGLRKKDC